MAESAIARAAANSPFFTWSRNSADRSRSTSSGDDANERAALISLIAVGSPALPPLSSPASSRARDSARCESTTCGCSLAHAVPTFRSMPRLCSIARSLAGPSVRYDITLMISGTYAMVSLPDADINSGYAANICVESSMEKPRRSCSHSAITSSERCRNTVIRSSCPTGNCSRSDRYRPVVSSRLARKRHRGGLPESDTTPPSRPRHSARSNTSVMSFGSLRDSDRNWSHASPNFLSASARSAPARAAPFPVS